MIFVDQMQNLKIYKRPMYLPTVDGDKKKGSAVLLLSPNYDSSKNLITSKMLINKKRFESYYLNPNVSFYINGKVAKGKDMDEYVNEMSVLDLYHNLTEMTAEERNKIPDSKFGLPSKRKYPLDTSEHVRSAIKFFNYVDPEDEEELARNIIDNMGKFFDSGEMPKIGKDNRLSKYMTESVILTETSSKIPNEIPDDIKELYKYLYDFSYGQVYKGKPCETRDDFFDSYKSLSIEEFEKYKTGVCWDFTHYEAKWFKDHGYKYETYFIEVNDIDGDLPTHTFLIFFLPGSSKTYYFERSWWKYAGIEAFNSKRECLDTIMKRHCDDNETKINKGTEVINKFDATSTSFEHLNCTQYYQKASGGKTNLVVKEDSSLLSGPSDESKPGPSNAFHKGTHSYKKSPFGKAQTKADVEKKQKTDKAHLRSTVHEGGEIIINEHNLVFSTDHILYNMELLDKGFPIMLITGYPGSGKSTMLAQYTDKYDYVEPVSLDLLTRAMAHKDNDSWRNPKYDTKSDLIVEYVDERGLDNLPTIANFNDPRLPAVYHDFMEWITDKATSKKRKSNLIVIEGLQILQMNPEDVVYMPLVITGTSALKSWFRKQKRDVFAADSRFRGKPDKAIKSIFGSIKSYIQIDRQINGLMNNMISEAVIPEGNHFYFYHLVPKGSDMRNGIVSLQYQYDNDLEAFRHNAEKYVGRMTSPNGWNYYPGKDTLTDDEIISGLNRYRGIDGANRIYLFRFPPYKGMGRKMDDILKDKDIYRIDLNDPALQKEILSIDWGFEGANSDNDKLDRAYYENITPEEYFENYSESDGKLLFSHMNHISLRCRSGCIPKKYITKISTPTIMIAESSVKEDDGILIEPVVEEKFWVKGKNGTDNALVRLEDDKKLYRGKSEMIVVSQDFKSVYLAKADKDPDYPFRLPGGSWDENEDEMFAAIRETREEARLEVTNTRYITSYAFEADCTAKAKKYGVPEKYWWDGYYIHVYVGTHNGAYMGKIAKVDQDPHMIQTGKFYPIGMVMNKLRPIHQKALKAYLDEHEKLYTKGIKASHILSSGIIRDKSGNMLLEWHNKAQGYVLPSGKANKDETPYEALVREMREELGIEVTEATLNTHSSYQADYPKGSGNWVIFDEYNYIINSYEGIIENKEPDKHKELVWMNESDIMMYDSNITDELANYIDIYKHTLSDPDDVLYSALAQFIWFNGSRRAVDFIKDIFTPQGYYNILTRDLQIPINSIKDIPIINIEINPEATFYSHWGSYINAGGYMVIDLFIPSFNGQRSLDEYIKETLLAWYTAILDSLYPESDETLLPFIVSSWFTGRKGHTRCYDWGEYLFQQCGMPIPQFLEYMKTGNTSYIFDVLSNDFSITSEDLKRLSVEDIQSENAVWEQSHMSYSLLEAKKRLGTISEIFTYSDSGVINEAALSEDSFIKIGNTMTIFEASTQDTKLLELLYSERIRQRGQLLPLLDRAKADMPDTIKYAYPDIERYKNKNIFVDLYYYNELFFRNNTWQKEKGYKLYLELLKRLINDPVIKKAGYKRITLFVPVLDWNMDRSQKMWMYNESINPISVIFNLMKKYPDELKKVFGKMDIIFFGRDKYFKLNFNDFDEPGKIAIKFSMFIKKLWAGEEFDPEDEDTSLDNGSPDQITTDLVDKIEDAKGVDLTKNVKVAKDRNATIDKAIKKNAIYDPMDQPIVASDRHRVDQPTNNSVQAEDIMDDEDSGISKGIDIDQLKQQEDDLNHIAARLVDAGEAKDIEDAISQLDNDDELKEILMSLNTIDDSSIKIDATRAARMNKLDQDFLNSNVGGKSIKDILNGEDTNKPLEKTELSISSPNEQWKEMTYMNFDKDYDLDKDIINCFYHFTKTSKPIAIRSLHIEDNSTSEDRLNLYTCEMEDFKGTRFTIKLDVPRMEGNRLRLRGNDKFIQNQLFNMPIIKTEPDTCQIVTNYQKIFIRTYNTVTGRSMPLASRLIKSLAKYEGNKIKIVYGDNSKVCDKYDVPNDYLDLSGVFTKIETDRFIVYFNQDELREKYPAIDYSKGMPYGITKSKRNNKSDITEISYYRMEHIPFSELIVRELCEDDPKFKEIFDDTKASSSGVYSQCSILNAKIPLVVICGYVEDLTKVLKKANVRYRLTEKLTAEDKDCIKQGISAAIRFEDGYIVYDVTYPACMLLNGLAVSGTENHSMMDIDNKNMYLEMLDIYGGRIKSDGLDNFADCLVDPITYETLQYYNLPTDFVSILLYANVLLCDNKYIKHTDMSSRRVRRTEQIAAYTYEALSESYGAYANMIKHSRGKATMTVKQSAVIDKILASPISGDDSTINALEAAETTNSFTSRGKAGMNEQRSYTLDKRIYDDSMVNVLGMSTSYSANVSITRPGTLNMNVDTSRGYIKSINGNTDKMNAANTLSATEALTPFGSTRDDAPRTLMTYGQTAQHMVMTENADPLLVTNGADEALAYVTTDKFAHKAKKKGTVIELTDEYMIIDYGSNKEYINLTESIEKNSNGGFYTPIKLDVADGIKVGSKVKENQIVAYCKKAFSNSVGESDNIAYNIGKLVKVAILNTDECFEDSGVCIQRLAEKLATKVIDMEDHTIDKDSNVFKIINIGDTVEPEDPLLIWQNPHEEEEANTLLRLMGDDQEMVSEIGRRTIKSEISGKVADIKIYRTVEIEELSPSLQKIIKAYEAPIKKKKKMLESHGINADFLPPTYKLEPTGKLKKAQDAVRIEFFLERIDNISVGDKLTNYSANKAIIKNIISMKDAPYTDSRPNEPIDIFIGETSIDKRMVTSTMNYGSIQKLLIEADRTIKDMLGIPYDDSQV